MRDSTITIAVVRPSLLGTYGDRGNATVLAERLRRRGFAVDVLSIDPPKPVPQSSDLLVLGGGEDDAQVAVAEDRQLRTSIAGAVASGAVVLGVCGGFQLLGSDLLVADGGTVEGLGLVDWRTTRLPRRAVGEIVCDSAVPDVVAPLTGFENHAGLTVLGEGVSPLGTVRTGAGVGNGSEAGEGGVSGRIVGTYLHGPVLARNPQLADHLLSMVVGPLDPLPDGPIVELRRQRLEASSRRRRRRWRR